MNRITYIAFAIASVDLAILGRSSDGREFSHYHVVSIEPPPGTMLINPLGINSSGVVVGSVEIPSVNRWGEPATQWKAFMWDFVNGFRFLPQLPPNREFGGAFAINDLGIIAGESFDSTGDGGAKATIWSPQQAPLNISANYFFAVASDINGSGTVVGQVGSRAAIFAPGGAITLLSGFPDINPSGFATAVNESNVVVGTISNRAFIWDPHPRLLDLGPPENISCGATDVNSTGDVIGDGYLLETNPSNGISKGYHVGMVWYHDASEPIILRTDSLVSLAPFELAGAIERTDAHARAISDEGDVIGYVEVTLTSPSRGTYSTSTAYIWNQALGSKALDELLVADSAGWHVQFAYNQNRFGVITGLGQDPNGQYRAIILTPVPEPALGGYLLTLAISFCRFRRL